MAQVKPGEVWWVDLGLAAKVRPCLVLSDHPADDELALVVIVPHTTAIRGNRWELAITNPKLSKGVFHLQQVQPVSLARFSRRICSLSPGELSLVRERLVQELRLGSAK